MHLIHRLDASGHGVVKIPFLWTFLNEPLGSLCSSPGSDVCEQGSAITTARRFVISGLQRVKTKDSNFSMMQRAPVKSSFPFPPL